ncbi:MAG: peroxiredoxin [Pyrinomonadaceae bacterium]
MSQQNGTDVGDVAPDFTLPDTNNHPWQLSARRGKTVVLLFYPGDNTPICTTQMCSLRDHWNDYQTTGAEIVGVSTDSIEKHRQFIRQHRLPLRLLADTKGEIARLYGAKSWLPGRAARAVVVIDREGVIRYRKVEPLSLFRPKDNEIIDAIKKAESRGLGIGGEAGLTESEV